jgi:hypothetical protein
LVTRATRFRCSCDAYPGEELSGYRKGGRKPYRRYQFSSKYTAADTELLAEVDRAHERLSGAATRHILKREYEQFGQQKYVRLAGISVAHLYNLRNSQRYRKAAAVFEPTKATPVSIGERRKPDPQGRRGYLRVDTVLAVIRTSWISYPGTSEP